MLLMDREFVGKSWLAGLPPGITHSSSASTSRSSASATAENDARPDSWRSAASRWGPRANASVSHVRLF
jgi:hypothetical protein